MSSIDNRVVSMEFDNKEFERKLSDTIASLNKLSDSLQFVGAQKGFSDISAAADGVDFSSMSEGIDNISSRFSVLGAVGFTVIQSLTQAVLGFASNMIKIGKTDILAPILSGGKQRSMNIEQAKFMFEGLGLNVTDAMKSANDAVLGTAFGLDEAAKAAAQFGASGIKVGDQMTSALRGVAGAAAMTGSSFTEIADIFAGSAGSGKVNTMDLLQFSTRGLNAAAAIAPILGKTEQQVRDMASHGNLDFKTFADAMDKAFGKHATEANKTFAGSLSNLHAAMSRLGASILGPKLEQERTIFNSLSPVIDHVNKSLQPFIKSFTAVNQIGVDKINKFLQTLDFKNFDLAIPNFAEAFTNAFAGIGAIIAPIKQAFTDIFPPSTTSLLLKFSEGIKALSEHLTLGAKGLSVVHNVFEALFGIIKVGLTIIKEIGGLFGGLHANVSGAGEGLAGFIDKVAVLIIRLNNFLVQGGAIHRFFITLREDIAKVVNFLQNITDKVVSFFKSFNDSGGAKQAKDTLDSIGTAADNVAGRFGHLMSIPDQIGAAWDNLHKRFQGVFDILDKVGAYVKGWFASLGHKIAEAFQPGDFKPALDILNVGLLGGITLMLRNFLKKGFKEDFGLGFVKKLIEPLDALTDKLKAMTLSIKVDALFKLAEAIALLTISLVALSLIDSASLTKALTAMAVGFGELSSTMILLDKSIGSIGGGAKLTLISGAIIAISGAMVILTGAIFILSKLSPKELAVGLAGISAGLALLVTATNLISTNADGLIAASAAMVGMSMALLAVAGVVKIFATMSLGELAAGLSAIAVTLAELVGATLLMSTDSAGLLAGTAAILGLSGALLVLSGVVKIFASMSLGELGKGLGAIALSLGILVGATLLMSTNAAGLLAGAAAMVLMAGALNLMAGAILIMGQAGLDTLAKGIGAMAAMLLVLVVAVNAMDASASGAAAMLIVAGALLILTHVLEELGKLSIAQIATGLATIAAVFLVLGGAAILLAEAIPALLGLGAALALIGIGFGLFGAAAYLVAKAFEAIAKSGVAGAKAIVEIIKVFITAKFEIAKALVGVIVSFLEQLLTAVPLLVRLLGAAILQILETIIQLTPQIATALGVIITQGLALIRTKFPEVLATGFELLMMFLQGIQDHISEIVTAGGNILVSFLQGIADNIGKIAESVTNIMVAFITAIISNYQQIIDAGFNLLINFLLGIANNITKVIEAVGTIITTFITAVGNLATRIAKAGADALITFLDGVKTDTQKLIDKGVEVAGALLDAIAGGIIKLTNKIGDVLINFLNGMADAIRTHDKEIKAAGLNLAAAVVDGLSFGLASKAKSVWDMGWNLGKKALGGAADAVGAKSPATEFIKLGGFMVAGMALALNKDKTVINSAANLGDRVISTIKDSMSQIPDSLAGMENFNPIITPILDLTKVQKASTSLQKMMAVSSISAEISLKQAQVIAKATVPSASDNVIPTDVISSGIKFEQNIYAPEALSTNDIYRNTKSQIVLAKEKLGI